jgi:hypothetical protein
LRSLACVARASRSKTTPPRPTAHAPRRCRRAQSSTWDHGMLGGMFLARSWTSAPSSLPQAPLVTMLPLAGRSVQSKVIARVTMPDWRRSRARRPSSSSCASPCSTGAAASDLTRHDQEKPDRAGISIAGLGRSRFVQRGGEPAHGKETLTSKLRAREWGRLRVQPEHRGANRHRHDLPPTCPN